MQILIDIALSGGKIDTEANEIAQILLPPPAKGGDDAWARKGAMRLLAMRMEYLAHFERELCSLAGLWRFVNANQTQIETAFAMMATCGIEAIERKSGAFDQTFTKAPKQFEAYKSEAQEALDAFEPGKALGEATSAHAFDLAVLKRKPHTVYLILPAEKIGVAGAWTSLILNVSIETIAREPGPIRTTFLLDEFALVLRAGALLDGGSREAVKEFEDQAAVMTMKAVHEPDLIKDLQLWSRNTTVPMRGVSHNGGMIETAAANFGEARRPVLQSEDILGLGTRSVRF